MAEPAGPSRSEAITAALGGIITAALVAGARVPVRAQNLVPLRLGSGLVEDNAESFYALDTGLFKKNGIDAQLTTMRGGELQMSAVVSGQLDAAEASTVAFGSAVARGVSLIAVASGMLWDARYPSAAIVVKPSSP